MKNETTIIVVVICMAMLGCEEKPSAISPSPGKPTNMPRVALSTGEDDYGRVLEISVSDLAGTYRANSPIPITVRITNRGPVDTELPPKHPGAQLFPHLTVWVAQNSKVTTERMALPIQNRVWIKKGGTFEQSVDLSKVTLLSALGEYDLSIGHENGVIEDMGDWTGTLRSRTQTIEIKAEE